VIKNPDRTKNVLTPKLASDESFYALVISGKLANWNDYPARILEQLLLSLSGGTNFCSALLFSKNRDRLLEGDIAAKFLAGVLAQPKVNKAPVKRSLLGRWHADRSLGLDEEHQADLRDVCHPGCGSMLKWTRVAGSPQPLLRH
jgi:hypothetical protein